jgi:WD40 repeat protein
VHLCGKLRSREALDAPHPRHSARSCQAVRIFAVDRPGRECELLPTWDRGRRDGQAGLVSCFAFNPDRSGLLAAGAYDCTAALYDFGTRTQLALLHGHAGGVTHARFSPDGNYLYTGARRDAHVLCWDIRATAGVVYRLRRATEDTNQRVAFDIEPCGRHLASGGTDGEVRVFDLARGEQVGAFAAAPDTVRGVRFGRRCVCARLPCARPERPSVAIPCGGARLAGPSTTPLRRWRPPRRATAASRSRRTRRAPTRCACGASADAARDSGRSLGYCQARRVPSVPAWAEPVWRSKGIHAGDGLQQRTRVVRCLQLDLGSGWLGPEEVTATGAAQ